MSDRLLLTIHGALQGIISTCTMALREVEAEIAQRRESGAPRVEVAPEPKLPAMAGRRAP